jgi:RNA polymerase sigma-70 factor (ECF subfamily)
MPEASSVTELLNNARHGDQISIDQLVPLIYTELRRIAGGCLRNERSEHTLQPTALVHEAYIRLIDQTQPDYQSRAHFFGIAAQVMRQILVDHARSRNAAKRGGGAEKLPLELHRLSISTERPEQILALEDGMQALARFDPQKARLVEMRFFGGLTAEESAEILAMPVQTVRRELRVAQAWLKRELDRCNTADPPRTA